MPVIDLCEGSIKRDAGGPGRRWLGLRAGHFLRLTRISEENSILTVMCFAHSGIALI